MHYKAKYLCGDKPRLVQVHLRMNRKQPFKMLKMRMKITVSHQQWHKVWWKIAVKTLVF